MSSRHFQSGHAASVARRETVGVMCGEGSGGLARSVAPETLSQRWRRERRLGSETLDSLMLTENGKGYTVHYS